MVTITDRKGKIYVIEDAYGQKKEISADLLRNYMKNGLNVSNAHLSKTDRIMQDKTFNKNVKKSEVGFKRTKELAFMTTYEKVQYYRKVFLPNHTLFDLSEFTIDELDMILYGSLDLEISDRGSSTVDMLLSKNLYVFPTVAAVIKEVINRRYLTEDQARQYLIGFCDDHRLCNLCSFAEWIVRCNKEKKKEKGN